MKIISDSVLREKFIVKFNLREHVPEIIVDVLALQRFQSGEYLCYQEDELEYFYMLLSGKLQVDLFNFGGNYAVFSFETPFSIIGDLELFEGTKITSNVQALDDSLVFAVPVGIVQNFGFSDEKFLRFVIHHLVKKLRFSSNLLSQIPLSVEYRLARYLLYRMEKEGKVLQLEKREALAAMLGVSVRHLNRTLKQMAALNTIEVQNKRLTIVNTQELLTLTKKGT